jgi:hypothetical protein
MHENLLFNKHKDVIVLSLIHVFSSKHNFHYNKTYVTNSKQFKQFTHLSKCYI